jgi:two-component system phosphoglycerate transport system response regulator PgtA
MPAHTILIVDDEPSILDVWTRILLDEGYLVACAADAFDALRVLNATHPTVAICDVHLPGPSGVWLADVIREKCPNTAILLVSGDPFVPPRETLRPAVVAYLLKPSSREELVAAVKAAVLWSSQKAEGHP